METFHCDLCRNTENPDILEKETDFLNLKETPYRICRCKKCNLMYMKPQPTWEELKKVYNEDYVDKKYYDIASLNEKRIREVYPKKIQILKIFKPSGKLLDIGAGVGSFVYLAKKEGYDAEGWEPSNAEVALAKRKYNIDLKNGILPKKYYPPESFDIIHMHHVLEHVSSPTKTLRLILNLLKPEGYFYFEVPNEFSSSIFNYNKLKKIFLGKNTSFSRPSIHHLYFFDYFTILKYVKNINFKLVFIKGRFDEVNFKLPLLKHAFKILTISKSSAPAFELLLQKS